ncbi:MAG: hypothetical protein CMJ81_02970, partial [Planctomycetaceae bacterium]|nr:hypothetical protein [Planctomycetaceae bacterium]
EGAVDRGEVSREEADMKYREFRRRTSRERDPRRDDHDDPLREKREGFREHVEGAVDRGEISREEADMKYREFRQRKQRHDRRPDRADGDGRGQLDWGDIKRRVEGALERGDISREEAETTYRALGQRLPAEPAAPDQVELEENPPDNGG